MGIIKFQITKKEMKKILLKMKNENYLSSTIEIEFDDKLKADSQTGSDFYRAYQKSAFSECVSDYLCCAGDNQ